MGTPLSASTRHRVALFTQPESAYDFLIAGCVLFGQISQVPAPLADHLQKTPPGVVVLFVALQMLDQLVNPGRKKGNLNLWGTRIIRVYVVLVHYGCFLSLL